MKCPKCGSDRLDLYSHCAIEDDYNAFAWCKSCGEKYILKTELKAKGCRIYQQSIKKAEREWDKLSKELEAAYEANKQEEQNA